MKEDDAVVKYDEYEARFMNHMVQTLFDYLPDMYRQWMYVSSRSMPLERLSESGRDVDGRHVATIPMTVTLNSPHDPRESVSIALDTIREDKPSELVEGKDYRSAFEVNLLNDKGEHQYMKIEEKIFDSRDDDYSAISAFLEMVTPFVEGRFGKMTGERSAGPSVLESVRLVNDCLISGLGESFPDDWDVEFHESFLKNYDVPFVNRLTVACNDDYFVEFHVDVDTSEQNLSDMDIEIKEIGAVITANLFALPEATRFYMRGYTDMIAKCLMKVVIDAANDD